MRRYDVGSNLAPAWLILRRYSVRDPVVGRYSVRGPVRERCFQLPRTDCAGSRNEDSKPLKDNCKSQWSITDCIGRAPPDMLGLPSYVI